MIVRCIPPKWLKLPVIEDDLTMERIREYNANYYNIYYFPNYPKTYQKTESALSGEQIDSWEYVFVDMDLKDGIYLSKEEFIEKLSVLPPTTIVDSGNGVHAYWRVTNLDVKSYLRLTRRLIKYFRTDTAVGKILQLMRLPNTVNTKDENNFKLCETLSETNLTYDCQTLNSFLPPITIEDEEFCNQHYDMTFSINSLDLTITDELPSKWGTLLRNNSEVKQLWAGSTDDRSKNDYRLGHIMHANGFTKDEAATVLANSAKALLRAPPHRLTYAQTIISKIWTFEQSPEKKLKISSSVKDILSAPATLVEGKRFPCYKWIDGTETGFRLGHVMGLVAGSGVGKTAIALNIFMGFVENNPEYDHFFVPLEQTSSEIALRWKALCGENTHLHEKVHVVSNYDENGTFRDLSLNDIKEHILEFKRETGRAVGCVVIDHIGVLCNTNKLGQDEGLKLIAKSMKGFAIETNTFLIMQSQTSREKSGIGDLELNKDSAFGTSVFENFCDFLVTVWQPLKRCYKQGAPTVTAYKFCKIRHKTQNKDRILEDTPYKLFFNPETQKLRHLTQEEDTAFSYWLTQATNKRKADRKTDLVAYDSVKESITEGVKANVERSIVSPEVRARSTTTH